MNTRNYRLIAVNERTGNKTTLSDDTLTHVKDSIQGQEIGIL